MKKRIIATTIPAILLAGSFMGTAAAGGRPLTADLAAGNEVPPAGTVASGTAALTLNQGQGEICVEIDGDGFASSVLAGHIHAAPAGVNGPVVVNLGINAEDFSGCTDGVDKDLIKAIRQHPENYYVNIHSADVPSGEIRGQLTK